MKKHMEELLDQSNEQLEALLNDLSHEIYEMRCEIAVARKTDKPHKIKEKKKQRARINSILSQRMRGEDGNA